MHENPSSCALKNTPMVFSEARHYSGSQMIALAVTTGWATRLWPLLRAQLRAYILCSKWKKVKRIISQYPFLEISKEPFFWWKTLHAYACWQSRQSLFRQAKADMPAGRWRQIWQACYMHAIYRTDQLTCFKLKSSAMLPSKELSNLPVALLWCDFHLRRPRN